MVPCAIFSPTPTITWSRGGGKAMPASVSYSQFKHEIRINVTSIDDEGEYACTGSNSRNPGLAKKKTFNVFVECQSKTL